MQIALGQALVASRGWGAPELGEAYARARQLSPTLNRPRATLSALYGEYLYRTFRADLESAAQLAAAIRDFGESDGAATQMIGYNATWYIHLERGEFAAARVLLEKGLSLPARLHGAAACRPAGFTSGSLIAGLGLPRRSRSGAVPV